MLSSFWVASTKPEAALARSQGRTPCQERGWTLAPRDRGPEADVYRWEGHYALGSLRFLVDDLVVGLLDHLVVRGGGSIAAGGRSRRLLLGRRLCVDRFGQLL